MVCILIRFFLILVMVDIIIYFSLCDKVVFIIGGVDGIGVVVVELFCC